MPQLIVPIVEGKGEIKAARLLIRRILHEYFGAYEFQVASPKRLPRNQIETNLERALEYSATEPGCKAIIVLMDSDRDCPRDLAAQMSRIATGRDIGLPVAMVCPNTEFEAWFIASIEHMKGLPIGDRKVTIRPDSECPDDPEAIRSAKGWITEKMPKGVSYKPTMDQEPMTRMINLELANSRSRSFQRMCDAVGELVSGVRTGTIHTTPRSY